MCSDCNDWNLSGIAKRDFRHSKDGPEEIKGRPKRKSKWCKGKEGREHRYEQVLWYSHKYTDSLGNERVSNTYRWVCQGCGKRSYGKPTPAVPKHEHHYCVTKISDRRWKHAQEIYEECCVCGGKGRSYKFYD